MSKKEKRVEGRYGISLNNLDIIFNTEVSYDVLIKIEDELLAMEGMDLVTFDSEHGDMSLSTKIGDDLYFWHNRLPEINEIIQRNLLPSD